MNRACAGSRSRQPGTEEIGVRPARTADVRAVRDLVAGYTRDRILLGKELVTLYEDVQEFQVAVAAGGAGGAVRPGGSSTGWAARAGGQGAGRVVGCGALHVLWEDLAEVRTLAVDPGWRGRGVGAALLRALVGRAADLGVARVFCLTFEVDFFRRHGFEVIEGTPVAPEVYAQMLRSYDEGVAEFLDLERVKPNTLGNTRMLLRL